ncbi:MAG: M28 family metallopeptidase [Allosphingosinicella sp.]
MRFLLLPLIFAAASCATVPPSPEKRAESWWSDVAALADDAMEGRQAGTEGHRRAAAYVIDELREIGLEPAGTEGFLQPVSFEEQYVDHAASTAVLAANGRETPVRLPDDMIVGRGEGRRPAAVDAPLVFVGYGLHVPEAGHDDFAGVDLKGKIAVAVSGGPADISGALKAHARRNRSAYLAERGAAGLITLNTPKATESPWSRSMVSAGQPGLYFADPALRDVQAEFFTAAFNGETAEKLFAASGRSFVEIAALADASKPLSAFDMKQSLRARLATRHGSLESPNVVARLPGSDPALADEHVAFTAHLDGLGIRDAADGDRINNGALDNAAGVASLLDIARSYKARGIRPKRSMLFVFVTAEEKGLLGSRYFALRPTVPKLVANLNLDMALPIFPLKSVIALGAEESSLGAVAAAVTGEMGLPLVPDPFPDRNSFVRSDQYSFIREGVPALAFKFGFAANTPEAEAERNWRSTRYHGPADDLGQPVERRDAIRLDDVIAEIGLRVADALERPHWLAESFFRRFARD